MTRADRREKQLPVWPVGKPIPKFKTPEDEERFWTSYEFEDPEDGWEEIEGPKPPKPLTPRKRH